MKAKGYSTIAGLEKLTPEEIKQRNLEMYGAKIRAFRVRAGLSADQLADALQISRSSVRNWECGLTRPDPEFLCRMFALLDVEPNEFFGIRGIGTILTDRERQLLNHFRSLDEDGQEDLAAFAEVLSGKAHLRLLRKTFDQMRTIKDWGRLASAGGGEDWPEFPEADNVILFRDRAVDQADEIITVSGRSMEPQYFHGDRVLVQHCSALRNGDIGIFYVPGCGGVIKQQAYDRLHSLNPDFDDIFPLEEGARIVGRVLGKLNAAMIPGHAEQSLYREALQTLTT